MARSVKAKLQALERRRDWLNQRIEDGRACPYDHAEVEALCLAIDLVRAHIESRKQEQQGRNL